VAHGVNNAMKAVQAFGLHAAGDTPAMNANTVQLLQGNDAMLVCG
jgi:hypothetical protein